MNHKLSIILSLVLLFHSCKSKQMSPLDNEAFDQAYNYRKTHLSLCGDHFFAYYLPPRSTSSAPRILLECTQVSTVGFSGNEEQVLTEADRLNGLEWRGKCSFMCKSYRINRGGQWTEWKDGIIFNAEFPGIDGMPLQKIRGQWKFGDETRARLEPVSCDQVPKE